MTARKVTASLVFVSVARDMVAGANLLMRCRRAVGHRGKKGMPPRGTLLSWIGSYFVDATWNTRGRKQTVTGIVLRQEGVDAVAARIAADKARDDAAKAKALRVKRKAAARARRLAKELAQARRAAR